VLLEIMVDCGASSIMKRPIVAVKFFILIGKTGLSVKVFAEFPPHPGPPPGGEGVLCSTD
jgi:hypothetical protein